MKNEKLLNEHLVFMNQLCSNIHNSEKECISKEEFENLIGKRCGCGCGAAVPGKSQNKFIDVSRISIEMKTIEL